ncbi:isochorismatase family protein (plasmid) [Bosea sp. F3-2]|uniref:isochorismatase family protein n=1 Tax=Bosea sp. F3-2 TaxID=2599640 RepID=UPI0011ECDBCE|nr:isochorismatase family protein [Bosea sp. F3-2]QEL27331.1 isochorismatase family protein [Bosea sp. F3-2]
MLLARAHSAVLVIDAQVKLLNVVQEPDKVAHHITTILKASGHLQIPVIVSEQNPERLGRSDERVLQYLQADDVLPKREFSCLKNEAIARRLSGIGRQQIVVCGLEAHICVLQTAIDLHRGGYETFVVSDAVSSRSATNIDLAFRRAASLGINIVSSEMVLFEWLGSSENEAFRTISKLIR